MRYFRYTKGHQKNTEVPSMTIPIATSEDVRYAYRLILGREPDSAGLEHFNGIVRDRSPTTVALGQSFLNCAEYQIAHGSSLTPVEVAFDGYSLFIRPEDTHIAPSVMNRVYEPHVVAVLKEVLGPGHTFVDVGANIGFFAAMAAQIVGASGRVVAIEPMDKNVQLISAMVWKNGFRNVEVLPYAASSNEQIVPIVTHSGTSNGEIPRSNSNIESGLPPLFAIARTLDNMLRDLDQVDLIKFDIEGHELSAWQGFADGLARHRPMVLTEFHPKCILTNTGIEPSRYLEVLFGYGERVDVLLSESKRVSCRNPAQVMDEWTAADRRLQSGGTTHLDLFVKPKGR
jgi:FkbM family methyltransferase